MYVSVRLLQLIPMSLVALSLTAVTVLAQNSSGATPSSKDDVAKPAAVQPLKPATPATAEKPAGGAVPRPGALPNSARPGLVRDSGAVQENALSRASKGREMIDAVKQCNQAWDAGTHLTRQRWTQLCKTNLGERDKIQSR